MKANDSHLKIQAYLDGELNAAEVREVEAWLTSNPEAGLLLNELKTTRRVLRNQESEIKLPVTREFNWSQIQRRISQAEVKQSQTPPFAWLTAWQRYLLPVSGLAVVLLMSLSIGRFFVENPDNYFVEIENFSEETVTTSFRAQSEKMFVVWVTTKEAPEISNESQPGINEATYQ